MSVFQNGVIIGLLIVVMSCFHVSCRSIGKQEAPKSQLKGAYDSTYLLRLVQAEHSQPGVYSFETCLHTEGIATEQSCVPTFKNQANQAVQITLNTIENNQLTPQESQHIASMSQEYAQYHNQIQLNSASVSNTIAIGLGGTAGGIGGYYAPNAVNVFAHRLIPKPNSIEAEILELDKFLKSGIANSKDPLTTIYSIILKDTETVFEPELIRFLDSEGLPAHMRSWLTANKLSSAHYLVDTSRFFILLRENPLMPDFREVSRSIEGFDRHMLNGMYSWIKLKSSRSKHGKVIFDSAMLFKPQFRDDIVNEIVQKYNQHFEVAEGITKRTITNIMLGFDNPNDYYPPFGGKPRFYSSIDDIIQKYIGLSNNASAFLKHHPRVGYNLHAAYSKLEKLTPLTERLTALKRAQKFNEIPFRKGILGFLAKHKVPAGAAVGAGIVAVIMNFSDTSQSNTAESSQLSSQVLSHDDGDLTLIMDLSSALWSPSPKDQVKITSVEEMIKNIVMFQKKVWLDGDVNHAAMVDQYCLPSLNESQSNHKVCFST